MAGAAISGVGDFIGKNRLDAANGLVVKPGIAQAIVDNKLEGAGVKSIKNAFGVNEECFEEAGDVYKSQIIGMVKTPITKTSKIKELINLRRQSARHE